MSRTEQNFHKFFSLPSNRGSANSDTLFYDYDLIIKDQIFKRTVSSFPIASGLVSDQETKALVKWLSDPNFCAVYDTVASADEKESYFKPETYWRGPIWINTNWALWLGLLRYGYIERAERTRQGVFKLALVILMPRLLHIFQSFVILQICVCRFPRVHDIPYSV